MTPLNGINFEGQQDSAVHHDVEELRGITDRIEALRVSPERHAEILHNITHLNLRFETAVRHVQETPEATPAAASSRRRSSAETPAVLETPKQVAEQPPQTAPAGPKSSDFLWDIAGKIFDGNFQGALEMANKLRDNDQRRCAFSLIANGAIDAKDFDSATTAVTFIDDSSRLLKQYINEKIQKAQD